MCTVLEGAGLGGLAQRTCHRRFSVALRSVDPAAHLLGMDEDADATHPRHSLSTGRRPGMTFGTGELEVVARAFGPPWIYAAFVAGPSWPQACRPGSHQPKCRSKEAISISVANSCPSSEATVQAGIHKITFLTGSKNLRVRTLGRPHLTRTCLRGPTGQDCIRRSPDSLFNVACYPAR